MVNCIVDLCLITPSASHNTYQFSIHRLREGSRSDAERTGELVSRLGLEHHILTLNWDDEGGPPTHGKVQLAARRKRYPALLGLCEKLKIRNLMVAHHMDDQNGEGGEEEEEEDRERE